MEPDGQFDAFVLRASPRLLGTAILLTGDRGLGEDAVQETLVRLYRSWSRIRDPNGVDAYAYATLRRLCQRQWRRRGREVVTDAMPDTPTAEHAAEHAIEDGERAEVVRRLIRDLPRRQRQTVVLRFYTDLSVEDTATAMGCTPGTVKSQTAKGLATLRTRLADTDLTRTSGSDHGRRS